MAKKIKTKFLASVFILFVFCGMQFSFYSPLEAEARTYDTVFQGEDRGLEYGIRELGHYLDDNTIPQMGVRELVIKIINYLLTFIGLVAVIAIIYAGILWVTAGGNDEQIGKGKKIITWSLAGILLIVFSYAIVNFVISAKNGPEPQVENGGSSGGGGGSSGGGGGSSGGGGGSSGGREITNTFSGRRLVYISGASQQAGVDYRIREVGRVNSIIKGISKDVGALNQTGEENTTGGSIDIEEILQAISDIEREQRDQFLEILKKISLKNKNGIQEAAYALGTPVSAEKIIGKINPETSSLEEMEEALKSLKNEDLPKFIGEGLKEIQPNLLKENDLRRIFRILQSLKNSKNASKLRAASVSKELKPLAEELGLLELPVSESGSLGRVKKAWKIVRDVVSGKLRNPKKLRESLAEIKIERLILELEDKLNGLYSKLPKTVKNKTVYKEAKKSIDNFKKNTRSRKLFSQMQEKVAEMEKTVKNTPALIAKISADPKSGSAPLTVLFSGADSIDPTGYTIPHNNYRWWYFDHKGKKVTLERGPFVSAVFETEGVYIVHLLVETMNEKDGEKQAMDGEANYRLVVMPPASIAGFTVDGREVGDRIKVSIKDAKKGITFDPAKLSHPAFGRKFVEAQWDFGDNNTETKTEIDKITHKYKKEDNYIVTLRLTDDKGNSVEQKVTLVVKSIKAEIDVNPGKEGTIKTGFTFGSGGSEIENGTIEEYLWEIKDKNGDQVKTSEEDKFYYIFSEPGEYKVSLKIKDNSGREDEDEASINILSQPPVARFSIQQKSPETPSMFLFDARPSYDPDPSDNLTYSFDFDSDGVFETEGSKTPLSTFTFEDTGIFQVTLEVKDSNGLSDKEVKYLKVKSNLAVALEISPAAASINEDISMKAVSPSAQSFIWDFGDGKKEEGNKKEVVHKYNASGAYKISLKVVDSEGKENVISRKVYIGDMGAPVAVMKTKINNIERRLEPDLCGKGKDGLILSRVDRIVLDASDSINSRGKKNGLKYSWDFGDGEYLEGITAKHIYSALTENGSCYKTELTVKDSLEGTTASSEPVYIKVENLKPAMKDFLVSLPKKLVTPVRIPVEVWSPGDRDGKIIRYRWWYYPEENPDEKLGIITTQGPQATIEIRTEGIEGTKRTYLFGVELEDSDHDTVTNIEMFDKSSIPVTVINGSNQAPVVDFSMDRTSVFVGDTINFTASAYVPGEDAPMKRESYKWDFDGDGMFDDIDSGSQVSRKYTVPGKYTVRLQVTYKGLSSTKTHKVYIDRITRYPKAAFTFYASGTLVSFDAGNSKYDPALEDASLRFAWDFDVSKDSDGNGIFDDDVQSEEARPQFDYKTEAVYKAKLKVIDSLGGIDSVTREINLSVRNLNKEFPNTPSAGKNIQKKTIRITSEKNQITTLDLIVSNSIIKPGGQTSVKARIINADSTPYTGRVSFYIVSGAGSFSQQTVSAADSVAETLFKAGSAGKIVIKAKAAGTSAGDIEEKISIQAK